MINPISLVMLDNLLVFACILVELSFRRAMLAKSKSSSALLSHVMPLSIVTCSQMKSMAMPNRRGDRMYPFFDSKVQTELFAHLLTCCVWNVCFQCLFLETLQGAEGQTFLLGFPEKMFLDWHAVDLSFCSCKPLLQSNLQSFLMLSLLTEASKFSIIACTLWEL